MKATIKLNKAKIKSNITASISYHPGTETPRSYNFTGSMIELEGFYSSDNICYDAELPTLKVGTTAIINPEAGQAVYERCATIFAQRAAEGNLNPSVDLHLEFNTLNVKETNILISNVTKVYVESNTSLRDDSSKVNDALASLRKLSSNNSQVAAARAGMLNLVNKVKETAKTYL
jgi:hypothetical protein